MVNLLLIKVLRRNRKNQKRKWIQNAWILGVVNVFYYLSGYIKYIYIYTDFHWKYGMMRQTSHKMDCELHGMVTKTKSISTIASSEWMTETLRTYTFYFLFQPQHEHAHNAMNDKEKNRSEFYLFKYKHLNGLSQWFIYW